MIHETAEISPKAKLGEGCSVWNWAQIREGAIIGKNCVISKGVYIDRDVKIGNNCKIQNHVSVFQGVELKEGVFIGPHVCFTNDINPRAVDVNGNLKKSKDWKISKTLVKKGASIGANSTVLPVVIGEFAMIGAGSVVTKDVPDYCLVVGNPAKVIGKINKEGCKDC
jgi:UDP-2-acetamido-3-amino-2,3-dideoxy-glucuronate N-acetyltransferase